jgi:hypothetical protein
LYQNSQFDPENDKKLETSSTLQRILSKSRSKNRKIGEETATKQSLVEKLKNKKERGTTIIESQINRSEFVKSVLSKYSVEGQGDSSPKKFKSYIEDAENSDIFKSIETEFHRKKQQEEENNDKYSEDQEILAVKNKRFSMSPVTQSKRLRMLTQIRKRNKRVSYETRAVNRNSSKTP